MKQILACVPVDRSKLPQIPELAAVVITDLYTLKTCVINDCGDVWVGPRQLAAYNLNPDDFAVMCMLHALAAMHLEGDFDPDTDVIELGGGYPVEGRARTA